MDLPDQRSEGSPNPGEPSPSLLPDQDQASPSHLPDSGEALSAGPGSDAGLGAVGSPGTAPSTGAAGNGGGWYSGNSSAPLLTPKPRRRDHLSIWSIIIFIAFFALQAMTMSNWTPLASRHHAVPKYTPAARSALASDNAFTQLVTLDSEAKLVFVGLGLQGTLESLGIPMPPATASPGAEAHPPKKSTEKSQFPSILDVVLDADDALRSDPTNTDFARRVILLRAEAGLPPLAPVLPVKKQKGLSSPLDAFAPSPGMAPKDAAELTAEAALWKEIFSSPNLGAKSSAADLARQIRALPNLHWYQYLALHQLYLRSGNPHLAAPQRAAAIHKAIFSFSILTPLGLFVEFMVLIGILLLVALIVVGMIVVRRGTNDTRRLSPFTVWLVRLGQPKAPQVPDNDRRLGAGDLMDAFVVYLAANILFSLLFSYLSEHPWRAWLSSLSFDRSIDVSIELQFVVYVLTGTIPLALLAVVARRRGTSLFAELGLTTKHLGRNILFGLVGWGMASALMIAVELSTSRVFHNTPEPTNPVIELITGSSGILSRILLYVLASIAAPFFEETLFRGVFFNAARMRLGPWPAIILTGLVFGFAHPVGVGQALPLATLGAVFAWMAYTRKSLVPSMTGHFIQNTYSTLAMWLIFLIMMPR